MLTRQKTLLCVQWLQKNEKTEKVKIFQRIQNLALAA